MSLKKTDIFTSEAEYLHEEHHHAEFKNEYVDGQIYAMVGASANHNCLAGNLFALIKSHLKGSPCNVFQSDFKVKVGTKYFYPDVLVRCDKKAKFYTEEPTIIVEIISPSTAKYDRTFKTAVYQQIPSLIEYVIVEQDKCLVGVYHRRNKVWNRTVYGLGNDVHFNSIGLTLSVEEIYTDVDDLEYLSVEETFK